ncbi:hypothetical protein [Hyphomicrobium sp. D-2]|uniref:hypothetical protein n=1 Tax=Hyphomicrobium sp. D-2 TaxID=3041621 RepID=UPI002453F585|nr:hypothetical protein [Hyphomicrobium sp. D-2]MDH4983274.1 hypothetical protein [Hyphomicrobium sp. D-2]
MSSQGDTIGRPSPLEEADKNNPPSPPPKPLGEPGFFVPDPPRSISPVTGR